VSKQYNQNRFTIEMKRINMYPNPSQNVSGCSHRRSHEKGRDCGDVIENLFAVSALAICCEDVSCFGVALGEDTGFAVEASFLAFGFCLRKGKFLMVYDRGACTGTKMVER
jgi:hypothetical protein